MNVTWTPTPDSGVAGYNVYYGSGSRNYQNQVAVGNNLTAVVSGLTVGKQYYFAVTAVDAFGVESDFSGEAAYVMPGNQTPTISAIANQSGTVNQATGPIAFFINDAETTANSLTLSATSSSTSFVPNANIAFGGNGQNRTVTVTPAANQTGSTLITVSVSDGTNVASSSFTFSIQQVANNTPPTISGIAAQTISANQATAAIPFTVDDAQTAAGSLTVSGSSSATALVPNANIVFGGSGANRTVKVTPAANQSGSAQITVSVSDGTNSASSSFILTVQAQPNTPPTISGIAGQTIAANQATAAIPFTIGDAETAAGNLTVSGSSSSTTLVPNANIVFGGSGANRTVKVTPAANQSGSAQITVSVSDGTNSASSSFNLIVQPPPPNTPPTISGIAAQTVTPNQATAAIPFTIGDAETAAANLTVSGSSSSTTLIPNANIVFGGSGANRTVQLTPAANQTGSAQITVSVSDGTNSVSSSFNVTVQAPAPNTPPTISGIAAQTVTANQATAAIPFTIGDAETAAANLTVSGSSSSTTLIPNANIVFGGSGANRTVKVTPAANQTGSAQITVSVSDGTNSVSSSFNVTVQAPAPNTPPTISGIVAQTVTANQATAAIPFTIGDAETSAGNLTVSGSSSSTTLVPNANIVFGGSGANRTVKVTPAANQTGSAQITVSVSDGTNTVGSSFSLTVQSPANTAPTITPILNQAGYTDLPVGPVSFTVGDAETAAGSLVLSAASSNPSVVPNGNIVFGGSGANRTVTITPAAGQVGSANIMITVSDGTATAQSTFTVSFETPTALPKSELPATSTYNGLFYEDDAVRLQSAGSFKVTVASSGKYSGTVQMGAGRYSFSGQFGTFCQGTNIIVRKGLRSLVLNFGLNAGASANRFVGGISDGVFASQMHGVGTTFNASTHPAPYLGHYTIAVPGGDTAALMSLGNGFGSLSVDGGGNVKMSGVLADGTKVSQSSQISDDGTWPLFIPLYKGKGMLMAWISFTNRAGDDLHGSLNWIKQPDLLAKYYPSGFALAGDAIGSAYTPPSALELNTQLSGLHAEPSANAVLTSIKVTAGTGILKGSMIDRATGKPSTFQGVLLQKPHAGYGFVLGVQESLPVLLTQ